MRRSAPLPPLLPLLAAGAAGKSDKPNIVFFLTDDQDQMLGGSFPSVDGVVHMRQTDDQLRAKGRMATNMFIHTPICCPSRGETTTGRYFHNIKTTGKCLTGYTGGPGTDGECCFHVDNDKVVNQSFAVPLKAAGYTVGLFGKYLNAWPGGVGVADGVEEEESGPPKPTGPAPPGFDAWLANGGGSYYAPRFATQGVAEFGFPDWGWKGTADNYTTAIVGNLSVSWIRKVVTEDPSRPFFAYVAPKAAHEPFAPAPWYTDTWSPDWPATEPRPSSWNASFASRADQHHNIAVAPLLTAETAEQITLVFKDRWRTLLSVDDVIAAVIAETEALGVEGNTYYFYSSDHGFQLGEFNLIFDKRQVYDHNVRIHLLVRGPGVEQGSTFSELVSNVDLAPTWLGLAGLDKPASMDGKSMAPLLINAADGSVPAATRGHIAALGGGGAVRAQWRDSMFLEYYYVQLNTKCTPYAPLDPVTGKACQQNATGCTCVNIEDPSNNFIGLRHVGGEFGDTLYAEFQTSPDSDVFFDKPDFHEYYDAAADPWMVSNLYNKTGSATISALRAKLHKWFQCAGDGCD